jgi:hypothetical protein
MVLAAGVAVAFAGPASAVTGVRMCVLNLANPRATQCAVQHGLNRNITMASGTGQTSWDVPETGTHEIELAGSNNTDCMTVVSGNTVQVKTCSAASSQEWAVSTASNGDFIFKSRSVSGDCLNDHFQVGLLNVAPCASNGDQEFSLP